MHPPVRHAADLCRASQFGERIGKRRNAGHVAKYDQCAMNPTAMTALVDRVFGDRYRIDQLIGVGSISAVFVAFDEVDDHRVALKVFDEALADDERFIERLLDAVEHAATLVHPNIVEILDWGVDDGVYIVSELCEGGSLASLLAEGHTLEASQALVMALECSRALNHGHEQGAIHRNLTPRNVLFTDDQQVRISDYGLAKVLAEAPVAQAERAIENVRYASPERARGRSVAESSDLYSLALVVSEAVSGTPPQVADTVVGTLMDRAESPAVLDPALGDLLPPLERCGRVDPSERPEAEELAIALLAAAETMPRPEAMPLVGIGHDDQDDTPVLSDDTHPELRQTAVAARDDVDGVADENAAVDADAADGAAASKKPTDGSSLIDDGGHELDDFEISALGELDDLDGFGAHNDAFTADESAVSIDEAVLGGLEKLEDVEPVFAEVPGAKVETELDVPEPVVARRSAALAYEEQEDDADDKLPWWPLLVFVALIAGAVAAGVYFFALSDAAETADVPDLIGTQYDDIASAIDGRGWEVEHLESRFDGSEPGTIVTQSPAPGESLEDGGLLSVTVSLGNEMVEIPSDVIGLTVEQAESRLSTVGLIVGQISEENNEALGAGLVIGLNEPTTQMPRGESVDLLVSTGPEDRVVPDNVIGMTIRDATSLLVGLRLQAVEEPAFSPDIEVGTVLDSNPRPGEVVPADTAVTLVVSAGPEPVEMPDIVGLQLNEAIDVIEELGLIFVDTTGTPGEEVIGSLPPIGAMADVGTEVTIILNDPPDDE